MQKRTVVITGLLLVAGAVAVWAVAPWPRVRELWLGLGGANLPALVNIDEAQVTPYIDVLPEVIELNGIRTVTVTRPNEQRRLELRGQLNFDADTLVHVHARFPGQVAEIATVEQIDPNNPDSGTVRRPLQAMDRVKAGDRLAVLRSRDLGEKKSELIDSLIRYWVDEKTLERFEKLNEKGSISDRELREAKRQVDLDKTAVRRAQRTLRAWYLTDQELDEVEAEARHMHRGLEKNGMNIDDTALDVNWARLDVVASMDGTIVEKNVVPGDIVSADTDLFKMADLSRLVVMANVYEEDLRYLKALPRPIPWTVTVSSMPKMAPITGYVERWGFIDPAEHVALIFGKIDNPGQELMPGQFIKAVIEIPEPPDIVEIPTRALVEDGTESTVLVRIDKNHYRFASRRVLVVRRYHDSVRIRGTLSPADREKGFQVLHEGEEVVSAGALELKAAITQRQ
jgi:membrane fusion protein, heavy metal efflux system